MNANGEESWLAIETSGHAALRENYFLDDGAYLVAKLLLRQRACARKEKSFKTLLQTYNNLPKVRKYALKLIPTTSKHTANRCWNTLRWQQKKSKIGSLVSPNYEVYALLVKEKKSKVGSCFASLYTTQCCL